MESKRNTGAPGARGGFGAGLPGRAGFAAKPAASPAGSPKRPAAAAVPRSVNVQEGLDQLGKSIQELRIEFERFFNGTLAVPPEELRNRVVVQLRQLRNANLAAAVDTFRLSDLEARFNTYNELFNRRLREREEGRHAGRPPVDLAAAPRFDVGKGILVADAVEPAAAEALYAGLARGAEAPRFDLDSFQTYIERQAAAIRARTGCAQVQFRLAEEDGKLKLKARPVS